MASIRRWLAEYRRHPRWTAAGLAVIAIALAAAGSTWIMRQLSPPAVPAGALTPAPRPAPRHGRPI